MITTGNRLRFGSARHRGMVWFDTAIGMAMLATLIAVLAATHVQHRKTTKAFAESRAAVRTLEVQADRLAADEPLNDEAVVITRINNDWVRLSRPSGRGETELLFFLPEAAARVEQGGTP